MGRVDVDRMLAEMEAEQLDEWIAADSLDQLIGHEKLYQMLSLIAASLVNSWGANTKPADFIPASPADLREKHQHTMDGANGTAASPNQAAALFAMSAPLMGLGNPQ